MAHRWRDGRSRAGGYRWTCPFCGASRINTSVGESGRQRAIAALRSHISVTDGDGHGPRNAYPSDDEAPALPASVASVDGAEATNGAG